MGNAAGIPIVSADPWGEPIATPAALSARSRLDFPA